MTIKKVLLALPLTLALSGCIIVSGDHEGDWDNNNSNWKAVQKENLSNITKLSLGQSRSQVLSQMGDPNITEAFTNASGSNYQVLFYRTNHEHSDGQTTKDETTPLVFENDKLIGWGQDALQRLNRN
ncbi:MAG: DUF3192 domain-containing protein [Gammaproteobacteria bacterium]|nr:DUF3192 domain-containing protein [Gammaproteobacteria bacterium]